MNANAERAERANQVILAYQHADGKDDTATVLIDLVADLMHFSDQQAIDWEIVVQRAMQHHAMEATEEDL